jgi:predicted ATPase/transcriptional regulator with XRE-family HTH domain
MGYNGRHKNRDGFRYKGVSRRVLDERIERPIYAAGYPAAHGVMARGSFTFFSYRQPAATDTGYDRSMTAGGERQQLFSRAPARIAGRVGVLAEEESVSVGVSNGVGSGVGNGLAFSEWLRVRRKGRDLTQEELADRLGCSPETIRKFEAGGRRPSKQMAELLAEYLDVPREEWPAFVVYARSGAVVAEPEMLTISIPARLSATAKTPERPRPPTNLFYWRTSFIGRHDEVEAVTGLLLKEEIRLLTLTGPPGIGKTRLSFEVGERARDAFPDGVYFVALSNVTDPSLVVLAIAQTLGIKEVPNQPRLEVVKDYLREKQMLLILDNFEQVIPAGPLVVELLVACPKLEVIVSSREALHVYGEYEFPVPPLSMPDTEAKESPAGKALAQYEAVELFVERSQAVDPYFELNDANAPVIAEICRQLDGLPLAIELAAARSKVLAPQAILTRLSSRLKLLTTGALDLPDRQRTLRGAIAWSYDLLDEQEKALYRRTAIFAGGGTLEAIEAICRLPGEAAVDMEALDGVTSLLDKSLLSRTDDADGEPRFWMLWTIREFGLERLEETREAETIRRQHAGYFLALAEAAEPRLTSGERGPWMERLENEHNNLRAALEWCQSEVGDREIGLRLAGALGWFWYFRGYFSEGLRWLGTSLALAGDLRSSSAGAKALNVAGKLAWNLGNSEAAKSHLEESVDIWRAIGDMGDSTELAYGLANLGAVTAQHDLPAARSLAEKGVELFRAAQDKWGLAFALDQLADVEAWSGYGEEVSALYGESLSLFREAGDGWGIAYELSNLGRVALVQGDYDAARRLLAEGLAVQREVGDKWLSSNSALGLGIVSEYHDDYEAAEALYEEGLALARELGDKVRMAAGLRGLGNVAQFRGDYKRAIAQYEKSLALARDLNNEVSIAWSLGGLAGVAHRRGEHVLAARLFGRAEVLREAYGGATPPTYPVQYARNLAAVREMLGEEAFTSAWMEGRAMTIEQAIDHATKNYSHA